MRTTGQGDPGTTVPTVSPPLDTPAGDRASACRRENLRLEANKAFAASMLQMSDNPVLAAREYARFARDLNAAINLHNAVCKQYPVSPLPL